MQHLEEQTHYQEWQQRAMEEAETGEEVEAKRGVGEIFEEVN